MHNTFQLTMLTKLLSLTCLLMLSSALYSAQPAFHVLAGWSLGQTLYKEANIDPWLSAPFVGVASHVVADNYVGEGGLAYQVDIGIVRVFLMWSQVPDNQKDLFLWSAFWSLLPDIWDKSRGSMDFHTIGANPAVSFGETTNIAEEVSVLLFVIKF